MEEKVKKHITEKELAEVKKVDSFLSKFENYQITTCEDGEKATEDLRAIKSKYNEMKELRLSMTRPLEDSKKKIIAFFKIPLEKLEKAEAKIKQNLNMFIRREEEKRLEKERIEREIRAKELRQKADEAADFDDDILEEKLHEEADDIEDSIDDIEVEVEKPKGISSVKIYKGEVISLKALVKAIADGKAPISFVTFNMTTINQFIRAAKGDIEIPGVKVISSNSIRARQ